MFKLKCVNNVFNKNFGGLILANTGGLLGLFMGFSFLSAVEIGYYLLLRVWCLSSQQNRELKTLKKDKPPHEIKLRPNYPFLQ